MRKKTIGLILCSIIIASNILAISTAQRTLIQKENIKEDESDELIKTLGRRFDIQGGIGIRWRLEAEKTPEMLDISFKYKSYSWSKEILLIGKQIQKDKVLIYQWKLYFGYGEDKLTIMIAFEEQNQPLIKKYDVKFSGFLVTLREC